MAGAALFDFKVAAVLPAGGIGVRTGSSLPKQYHSVRGKPVIYYSIKAFESVSWIQDIVVPVAEDWNDYLCELCTKYGFKKVIPAKGGDTRFISIFEGIKVLKAMKKEPEVVIICDAARPFIDYDALRKVTEAAKQFGAAGATRPLVSTVLCPSDDGFLRHALDRTKHVASEMPQAFRYEIIYEGFSKATTYDFEHGTECLHIAQRYGNATVKLIPGNEELWKVTHKRDLYAMEYILKDREEQPLVLLEGNWNGFPYLQTLREQLTDNVQVITASETVNHGNQRKRKLMPTCLVKLTERSVYDENYVETEGDQEDSGIKCVIHVNVTEMEQNKVVERLQERLLQLAQSNVIRIGVVIVNSPSNKVSADKVGVKLASLIESVVTSDVKFLHGQVLTFQDKGYIMQKGRLKTAPED